MSLTPYQAQILHLTSQGMKPKEIAEQLGKSVATIYAMRDHLKKKGLLVLEGSQLVPSDDAPTVIPDSLAGNGSLGLPPDDPDRLARLSAQTQDLLAEFEAEIQRRREELVALQTRIQPLKAMAEQIENMLAQPKRS